VSGRGIARGAGGLYELLGLLPFERGVRASPLSIQRVGKGGMRLTIVRICLYC